MCIDVRCRNHFDCSISAVKQPCSTQCIACLQAEPCSVQRKGVYSPDVTAMTLPRAVNSMHVPAQALLQFSPIFGCALASASGTASASLALTCSAKYILGLQATIVAGQDGLPLKSLFSIHMLRICGRVNTAPACAAGTPCSRRQRPAAGRPAAAA